MKTDIIYQSYSGTIRQMPQNYLLAEENKGYWVCDPDPAANWNLVQKIFKLLFFNHSIKFGTGENFVNKIKSRK